MTEQITLDEALRLVDFYYHPNTGWRVETVKGNCITVEGYCSIVEGNCGIVKRNCSTVEGNCSIVEGNCGVVKGDCHTVKGSCHIVEGNCHTIEGRVLSTIDGRQWQYVETSMEKIVRLLEEYAPMIAVALETAVDQVISPVPPPCEDFDEYAHGFLDAHVKYRAAFLAIVAELRGKGDSNG